MAYDDKLKQRVEKILQSEKGFSYKKMFGGVCFLLHGNMACGIVNDDLIVRVGKENYETCLNMAHTSEFDMTGRPMTGWVKVENKGISSDKVLSEWLRYGMDTARSLPPK
jgi:TfoX/Sxy family transcriptional regulator of competence genes